MVVLVLGPYWQLSALANSLTSVLLYYRSPVCCTSESSRDFSAILSAEPFALLSRAPQEWFIHVQFSVAKKWWKALAPDTIYQMGWPGPLFRY